MPKIRLIAGLVLTAAVGAAQAGVVYTFDSNAQGWTIEDGGTLSHQPSGGNGGGFLQVADSTAGELRFAAPASALGDWSALLGSSIGFDALNIDGGAPDWAGFGTIRLISGATVLTLDGVLGDEPPSDRAWHRYSVPLTTALWGDGLVDVLADLTGFTIQGEFHNGVSETVGFDNIRIGDIGTVPEPASTALAGLALVAAGTVRRLRRR
jgi:hypothetical protein